MSKTDWVARLRNWAASVDFSNSKRRVAEHWVMLSADEAREVAAELERMRTRVMECQEGWGNMEAERDELRARLSARARN